MCKTMLLKILIFFAGFNATNTIGEAKEFQDWVLNNKISGSMFVQALQVYGFDFTQSCEILNSTILQGSSPSYHQILWAKKNRLEAPSPYFCNIYLYGRSAFTMNPIVTLFYMTLYLDFHSLISRLPSMILHLHMSQIVSPPVLTKSSPVLMMLFITNLVDTYHVKNGLKLLMFCQPYRIRVGGGIGLINVLSHSVDHMVNDALTLIQRGWFIAAVYLQSAYRSVHIRPNEQFITGLQWHFSWLNQPLTICSSHPAAVNSDCCHPSTPWLSNSSDIYMILYQMRRTRVGW